MPRILIAFALAFLALVGAAVPTAAQATPSYDGCTGFIHIDPVAGASIDAAGVWCLDHDVAMTVDPELTGVIRINADDVTVDCKGFRLVRSGGGDQAEGITGRDFSRLAIRNCDIRGFSGGIDIGGLFSSSGNVVEDNELTGNELGILVLGDGSIVRRNRVYETIGISAIYTGGRVDVVDNVVDGFVDSEEQYSLTGVRAYEPGGSEIRGNTIRGFQPTLGTAVARSAIYVQNDISTDPRIWIRDNVLVGPGEDAMGVWCHEAGIARFSDNVVMGFETPNYGCTDAGDNDITP